MFKSSPGSSQPSKFHCRYGYRVFALLLFFAVTALSTFVQSQTCSEVSFKAAKNIEVGTNLQRTAAVGDLNGDGKADIAVGGIDDYVTILYGHGTGSFEKALKVLSFATNSMVIGDFNGDGRQDLAVASFTLAKVRVFSGNATGGLDDAVDYPIGGFNIRLMVAGDFNHDGKPDLATAVGGETDIGVLLTNSAGGFNPPLILNSGFNNHPTSIVLADFNLDNNLDMVVSNDGSSDNLVVLLGDGAGNFARSSFSTREWAAPA